MTAAVAAAGDPVGLLDAISAELAGRDPVRGVPAADPPDLTLRMRWFARPGMVLPQAPPRGDPADLDADGWRQA